jgi:hypothetical protein
MSRTCFLCVLAVAAVFAVGCETPDRSRAFVAQEVLQESLFPSDQAVPSNDAIAQILGSQIVLPQGARIAVIRMGQPAYQWWSEDLARLDQDNTARFVGKLATAERVSRAAAIPALLLPKRITVPLVREAAARCQADVVVLYQAAGRTYEKQKFLSPNETKAYCVVEAVVLDTRSGIVPFATAAMETYTATKTRDDVNFSETVWKAETTALGKALDKIAGEIVAFLDGAP